MIHIRAIVNADRRTIVEIQRASIEAISRRVYNDEQIRAWAGQFTLQQLHEDLAGEGKIGLVAEFCERPVGFGLLNLSVPEIKYLFVSPDASGQGIGRALMERMERHAIEHGVTRLTLRTSDNALGFYTQAGYVVIDRRPYAIDNVPFESITMAKDLPPAPTQDAERP